MLWQKCSVKTLVRSLHHYLKPVLPNQITMQCTGALAHACSEYTVNLSCPVIAGVIRKKRASDFHHQHALAAMGYYFLGFGLLVCGFALWAIFNNLKLLLTGARVQGVIVGVDEQSRRGDSQHKKIYYHPVIEFTSEDGNPFQFTFGSGSTQHRPAVGKSVTVIYQRGRPDKATLNSFIGLWAGPLAASILGGGCVYGGVKFAFFGG